MTVDNLSKCAEFGGKNQNFIHYHKIQGLKNNSEHDPIASFLNIIELEKQRLN